MRDLDNFWSELTTTAEVDICCRLNEMGLPSDLPTAEIQAGFILICHSGSAQFTHFQKEHTLRSRDMIVVMPGDIFTLNNPSVEFRSSWVSFSAQAAKESLQNLPNDTYKYLTASPIENLGSNDDYEITMGYLKLLSAKIGTQNGICRREIVCSLLSILFMEIVSRLAEKQRPNLSEPRHKEQLLDQFIAAVNATPRCREVAYFAERLHITPKYLSSIVADGTGFTAKEYIDRNAVTKIKHLLCTTTLTVKQIAERLNFSGAGNLCRFFKSNTGMTISEIRGSGE